MTYANYNNAYLSVCSPRELILASAEQTGAGQPSPAPAKQRGQALPQRSELALADCWDLESMYANDELWEADLSNLQAALADGFPGSGTLAQSGANLWHIFQKAEQLQRQIEKIFVYAYMRRDEDTANTHYFALYAKVQQYSATFAAKLAWLELELADLPEETLAGFYREYPALEHYRHRFESLRSGKAHLLSEAEETLLAKVAPALHYNTNVFTVLDNADQRFPSIVNEQNEVLEVTHGRFGSLQESKDRNVRRSSFASLYSVYEQFQNTYATTLAGTVATANLLADLRGFSDARTAALFYTKVPVAVYDQLLTVINANLPLLHRYIKLRKSLLGLAELHNYDLHVAALAAPEKYYSIPEAKELIVAALAPLGRAYQDLVASAFSERWLDLQENQGKRSGAYSAGCYDSKPFIFMSSWQGSLSNVYTLAHELGHSCHSWYTRHSQTYTYGDYPIFLAEIASTTNENLLTAYLLEQESDEQLKRLILSRYLDRFKSVVFRQSQFAEFEHKIHQAAQAGETLHAAYLREQYGELNARYYGPELCQDKEIELEWARIPHFYRNFYVFQYATGFAAASAFAAKILRQEEGVQQKYLAFLASGSSAYPIETLLRAGLDMQSPEPLNLALAQFEEYLSALEAYSAARG